MIRMEPTASLSDKEIVDLYRNVVMYHELGVKRNYKVKSPCLQKYLKANKIGIEVGSTTLRPKEQDFLSKRGIGFWFKKPYESQVASLLRHLRNSVAHCKVTKQKINNRWYYCFLDQYRGSTTMLGKLPIKLLVEFIGALKSAEVQISKPANKR